MNLKLFHRHPWDVTPKEAAAIQNRLRVHVIASDLPGAGIERVAGIDVGFEAEGKITRAAVAVLHFPSLKPFEEAVVRKPTRFPYIPGLLSFREIPAVLAALERLQALPDVLICDGQGYAHPRRFGIACHLGVLTGIPAIGVGKTRLIGSHEPVPERRGAWVPLVDAGEVVGAVLRTREKVKPVYVSVGHRVSLATAVDLTLRLTTRYRLPETTRQAHRLASG